MSYIDQITVGSTTYDIKDVNAVTSVNGATGSVVITAASIGALPTTTTYVSSVNGSSGAVTLSIPSDTSDLTNSAGYITGMYIASYGSSTYADVLTAYQANKVVYCRASSSANPGVGSQNRMAFLAYVNDTAVPTEFEFQYYRSVATHTVSQQGDQVFVYKLKQASGWEVTTREAYTKIVTGVGLSSNYSSGTLTINNNAMDIVAIQSAQPSSDTNKLWIYDAEGSGIEIPTMDDVYGLGITGASAGQYLKVFSVDSNGRPTGYVTEGDNVLYYSDVAVAAASGDIASLNSNAITSDHIVAKIDWSNPQYIITNVTWNTSNGNVTLNGTCSSAITANILLIKKSN